MVEHLPHPRRQVAGAGRVYRGVAFSGEYINDNGIGVGNLAGVECQLSTAALDEALTAAEVDEIAHARQETRLNTKLRDIDLQIAEIEASRGWLGRSPESVAAASRSVTP